MCMFCLEKGAILKLSQLIFAACDLFAHLLTSCIQKLLTLPKFFIHGHSKIRLNPEEELGYFNLAGH